MRRNSDWRQRHQQPGDVGLADRARAPHHSPRATPPTGVVRRRQRLGGVLSYYYLASRVGRPIQPGTERGPTLG